ncbi:hypothetical protein ACQUFY_04575 [Robbsia andropogonis]|uniref:hypothetical protein n=1 Tax=Robbsia andropogonis TaxID=28092 RepID=UPI003D227C40
MAKTNHTPFDIEKAIEGAGSELVNGAASLAGLLAIVHNQTSGAPIDNADFLALTRAVIERVGTAMEDASVHLNCEPIGYFPTSNGESVIRG